MHVLKWEVLRGRAEHTVRGASGHGGKNLWYVLLTYHILCRYLRKMQSIAPAGLLLGCLPRQWTVEAVTRGKPHSEELDTAGILGTWISNKPW